MNNASLEVPGAKNNAALKVPGAGSSSTAASAMVGADKEDKQALTAMERLALKSCSAPRPEGITQMTFDGPGHAKAAFEKLAGKGKESIGLEKARAWLRSLAWTLADEELDEVLMSPNYTSWTLKDLLERNAKNQHRKNGDRETLLWGLKKLSHSRSSIGMDELQDLVCNGSDGTLKNGDFMELMKIVGLEKERMVNCEVLIQALLAAICQPPTASELLSLGWGRSRRQAAQEAIDTRSAAEESDDDRDSGENSDAAITIGLKHLRA
jgi:hypothetical protein